MREFCSRRVWVRRWPVPVPVPVAGGAIGQWVRWRSAVAIGLVLLALSGCQTATDQAQDESTEISAQSHRRFIRVGSTDGGRQFNEEELRFLAGNFNSVLLAKFHAGWDIELHHEAARLLEELNPALRVFPYFSMKYRFKQNNLKHNNWKGRPFDAAWYLRDNEGNIVYRSMRKDEDDLDGVAYVDLANPEYREWALEILRSWLDAAPYSGISFDAAEPIGDYGEEDVAEWGRLLGPDRVEAYNEGIRTLLASARQLAGPHREVIFNGIAPTQARGPTRNLGLLEVTDGALDERFCLTSHGEYNPIEEDLTLMGRYDDKKLFLRTGYDRRLPEDQRERYGRYCLGGFLMGWRPGLTFFQFGNGYTADQLQGDIADMNLPIGPPVAPYRRDGDMLSRPFTNGEVYVNVGDGPVQMTLSRPLTRIQGGQELARLQSGASITIPARDAVFLFSSDFTAGSQRTP